MSAYGQGSTQKVTAFKYSAYTRHEGLVEFCTTELFAQLVRGSSARASTAVQSVLGRQAASSMTAIWDQTTATGYAGWLSQAAGCTINYLLKNTVRRSVYTNSTLYPTCGRQRAIAPQRQRGLG